MTAKEIIAELRPLGRESYKNVIFKHGVREPCFGVSVAELKKIQKHIKKDYKLALDLYDTGIYDAMYLAGLIADDAKMTTKDLQHWIDTATHEPLCGSTVPWVAAESQHGREMALKWIGSDKEHVAAAGWGTLSCLVALKDDAELDLAELKQLLQRVQKTIHERPDLARYQMNGFVIAVGSYVKSLTELSVKTGQKIGPVTVDMGETSCQVPFAPDYIEKVRQRGTLGKKRKTVKC
jgi:3-methyladenine DNA glycosylase AlkD